MIGLVPAVEREEVEICKGLIFRYRETEYLNSDGAFVRTNRMMPMRRKSCPGCSKCDWFFDCYKEQGVMWPSGLKEGELYHLTVVNVSTDWETGYVDDFDLEFVEYKEHSEEDNNGASNRS